VETPRNDASIGLVLKYDKESGLDAVPPSESGLMIRGEVRHILPIKLVTGKYALLVGINSSNLKLVEIDEDQ